MDKSLSRPRDEERVTVGVLSCTYSGIALFCSKKQAIEAGSSKPVSGPYNRYVPPWNSTSSFQKGSARLTQHLFQSDPVRIFNLLGRNTQSAGAEHLNAQRNPEYGDLSLSDLAMSHTIKDPLSRLNRAGIGSFELNQIQSSDNEMSIAVEHTYIGGDDNTVSRSTTSNKNANISLGPTYTSGGENVTVRNPTFNKADGNFILAGNASYNDGSVMWMGLEFKKIGDKLISTCQTFGKAGKSIAMGESVTSRNPTFNKADENFISVVNTSDDDGSVMWMGLKFNKIGNKLISTCQSSGKAGKSIAMGEQNEKEDGNISSTGPAYNGHKNIVLTGPNHSNANENFLSVGDKSNNNVMSTGVHANYDKWGGSGVQPMGWENTMFLGGCQDKIDTNPSGSSNMYDLLTSQSSGQPSNELGEKSLAEGNSETIVNFAPLATSTTHAVRMKRHKMSKKVSSNKFPVNVKSLLETGIFDGVPVKYYSWERKISLKGVIGGTGYLCSCDDCKYSKVLNAFEFEQHAGIVTKHPNSNIYFMSGKTIYAVVQELRETPRDMLFEAIYNVTGFPIHEMNFRIWKESYQTATHELQQISGNHDGPKPTE